jgi:hypothetical protein
MSRRSYAEARARANEIRKAQQKKQDSLIIKIQDSDLYDWSPSARLLLLVIAFARRTNEKAWVPPDMPEEFKTDMLGWCDMAQWRLAQRSGMSESNAHRWLNNNEHGQYQVIESAIDEHQRPQHSATAERPPRYKKKSPSRGKFTSENQPRKAQTAAAMASMGAVDAMDDEDEL